MNGERWIYHRFCNDKDVNIDEIYCLQAIIMLRFRTITYLILIYALLEFEELSSA